MDTHQTQWNEKVAESIIKHLEKRRMEGSYSPSAAQAKDEIVAMIPEGASVFRCGSMTAGDMGLWADIASLPGVEIFDPYVPDLTPEQSMELRRKGMMADLMIAHGAWDGINLDGGGSTTLVAAGADGLPDVLNVPVGNLLPGSERPVANHLGIYASGE